MFSSATSPMLSVITFIINNVLQKKKCLSSKKKANFILHLPVYFNICTQLGATSCTVADFAHFISGQANW